MLPAKGHGRGQLASSRKYAARVSAPALAACAGGSYGRRQAEQTQPLLKQRPQLPARPRLSSAYAADFSGRLFMNIAATAFLGARRGGWVGAQAQLRLSEEGPAGPLFARRPRAGVPCVRSSSERASGAAGAARERAQRARAWDGGAAWQGAHPCGDPRLLVLGRGAAVVPRWR